jgi:hypothetical protein
MKNRPSDRYPVMSTNDSSSQVFRFFVAFATSLGFGGMLASVALVERGANALQFRFHWFALVLLAIGFTIGWRFWKFVFIANETNRPEDKVTLKRWLIFLLILSFACFAYPMRFASGARFKEVVDGVVFAILALSVSGMFIWKTIQALERSEKQSLREEDERRKANP